MGRPMDIGSPNVPGHVMSATDESGVVGVNGLPKPMPAPRIHKTGGRNSIPSITCVQVVGMLAKALVAVGSLAVL